MHSLDEVREDFAATLDPRMPLAPMSIEETGLELSFLLRLTAKCATEQDTVTPSHLAERMKLSKAVVNLLIKELTKLAYFEARGLAGEDVRSDIRYALSSKGVEYAQAALRQSSYVGPAPVSLDAFCRQLGLQTIHHERVTPEVLTNALDGLVLSPSLIAKLGPAMNSGQSILLYGPPGNGKTSIAERSARLFRQTIFVPYAIEVGGYVISFHDEAVHQTVTGAKPYSKADRRWVECKRPVIKTGGELTLDLLDLTLGEGSNVYEAPIHLKASGGIFIIDDFGRQQVLPQALINRWIVPLERGYDFLTLHTGKKFKVPFDELVVFSTNIAPRDLSDEAGLRRLKYKIFVNTPSREDYFQIFEAYSHSVDVELCPRDLELFYDHRYSGESMASCYHPKYLLDFIGSYCEFNGVRKVASLELLERAWEGVFTSD
ncbi:putative ATPase with chaperone activity, associated with Flp pilus assembly [Sinorhizobium sojae CCBAU 05684]|uniref:Putative ATPase with chaperone activity, associated with Flp pilus assembly n=1 Tax=Sinorhizobium sojae CCBAU 05684 TaxID=716928 RepID=A0A249PF70_9HYPH|nr:ATPase AAA [Sinorhizobium sojae]ASY64402.1 putative ATPase with chaperone activity, associated with Flp pilus assembly [Sinorhizobium sojae CCBAU 05684]